MTTQPFEHWSSGDIYEQYMGRWSRVVASRFLDWLTIGPDKWCLDVGCGTGALTSTIVARNEPQTIIGLDSSSSFIHFALQQTTKINFVVGNATALPFAAGRFDAVVSGLVLNFIPEPLTALKNMQRVVKPGGIVAAYVWDYADKMDYLRYFWDAVVDLHPEAAVFHQARRFPICQPDKLQDLWRQAGLHAVSVDAIDITMPFNSFAGYWQTFARGNSAAPKYLASLEETQRELLQQKLQLIVPTANDGTIALSARVWTIRGFR